MNEHQWQATTDPVAMLAYLFPSRAEDVGLASEFRPSPRKLRLFACACCRQVWHLLTDPRSRKAVEVAERYADGEATAEEANKAGSASTEVYSKIGDDDAFCAAIMAERMLHRCTAELHAWSVVADQDNSIPTRAGAVPATQATLLRCIVGNPFRPVKLAQPQSMPMPRYRNEWIDAPCAWLTPQVLSIAAQAYEQPGADGTLDPATLSILADALTDAGCDNDTILDHLRSPGPHVRGCWVVDLVLGKE